MSIPTQMSLSGFVATDPQLTHTRDDVARCYMRIGVEHARKETDGTFTPLEPSYHDLVIYGASAVRANSRFRKGDSFVASGYIHEYEQERQASASRLREQFVARRVGHDCLRTRYLVARGPATPSDRRVREAAVASRPSPAVGT